MGPQPTSVLCQVAPRPLTGQGPASVLGGAAILYLNGGRGPNAGSWSLLMPAVSPAMICLIAIRKTMISGSVVMMMPANSVDQPVWNSPKNRVMQTGRVHFSGDRSGTSGKKKSFHSGHELEHRHRRQSGSYQRHHDGAEDGELAGAVALAITLHTRARITDATLARLRGGIPSGGEPAAMTE